MHEHIPRHSAAVEGSSDRSFGIVFAVVFLIIALYPLIKGQGIRFWSMIMAVGLLLLALAVPAVLAPLSRLWMKFGMLLHKIVSPVALGIVFYLTILPVGLLMRLFGKDPLRLRPDPAAESYWIRRDPPGPASDSLNNQF